MPTLFNGIPTSEETTVTETFNALGALEYEGTINDRVNSWLIDQDYEGSLQDKLYQFKINPPAPPQA